VGAGSASRAKGAVVAGVAFAFAGTPKGIAMLTATAIAVAYASMANAAPRERFVPCPQLMTRLSLE
jgi:hypothetical protein